MDRNKEYLKQMEKEYRRMNRSYYRFLSYNSKLDSMDLNSEEKEKQKELKDKVKNRFVRRINNRVNQKDWR